MNKILNYAIIPPNKNSIQAQEIENICLTKEQVYFNYKENEHHWTTDYVWNVFLPKLCKELDINFNKNDFIKVKNTDESGKIDLSYHIPKNDVEVNYTNITFNEFRHCKISQLRYNHYEEVTGLPTITYYHRLYLGCHKTSEIINDNSLTNRWLILNTDSTSILIVPILAVYYNKILVLDNRNNVKYEQKLNEYFSNSTTDYIKLMIDFNINNEYSYRNLNKI